MHFFLVYAFSYPGIDIVNIKPTKITDLSKPGRISITCRYNTKKRIQFFLVQNHSHVVVRTDYNSITKKYHTVAQFGFECTLIDGKEVEITCRKSHPTCWDATYYTCKTREDVSATRVIRGRCTSSIFTSILFIHLFIYSAPMSLFLLPLHVSIAKSNTVFIWSGRLPKTS